MPVRPRQLREAHAHIGALGESLRIDSLEACTGVEGCLQAAAEATRRAPGDEEGKPPFVRLAGARINAWTQRRWPTLAELDRATGATPCVILSFDHHTAVANTAALHAAGLRPGVPVPPYGVVCVDERTGAPTGVLMEQAAHRAWEAAPQPGPTQRLAQVIAALDHLADLGYAQVHDLHSQEWLGPLLGDMDRAGRLRMPVRLYPPAARLPREAASRSRWETGRVRLAGGKVFTDGTLNNRTAFMLHRYAEPLAGMPRGQCMASPAAIDEHIRTADALGLHLAFHAIGDGAVRTVLDCLERVRPRSPGFRIEHCEIIDAQDVPRFARLGVVCSVQPCHLLADVEALTRFVPHRLDRVLPLGELIDAGCGPGELLWFGSDVPIVRADPADSIQAAVHRRRVTATEAESIAPAQAISEADAWACLAHPADGSITAGEEVRHA